MTKTKKTGFNKSHLSCSLRLPIELETAHLKAKKTKKTNPDVTSKQRHIQEEQRLLFQPQLSLRGHNTI